MYKIREYQSDASLPGVYYTTRNNNTNLTAPPTNIVGLPTFISNTEKIKPVTISDRWDIQNFVKQYHPRNTALWINTCETILNNGSMVMTLPLSPSNGSDSRDTYGTLYADTSYFSIEITVKEPTQKYKGTYEGTPAINTNGEYISWVFAGSDLTIKPLSKNTWQLSIKPFDAKEPVTHNIDVPHSSNTSEHKITISYNGVALDCKIIKYANISENATFTTTIIGGALPSTNKTVGKHINLIGTLNYKGAEKEKTSYILELSKTNDEKNLLVKLYLQDNSHPKHSPKITEIYSNTISETLHTWDELCPYLNNTFTPTLSKKYINLDTHLRRFVFNSNNSLTTIENYTESTLRLLSSTGMYVPCVYIMNWTDWGKDIKEITKSFTNHLSTKYGLTTILIDEDADKSNIRQDKKSIPHPKIHVLKSGDNEHSLELGAAVASKISARSCDSISTVPITVSFEYDYNYNDDEVENYFKQGVICLHQMPYQTNPVIYSDITSYTGGDDYPRIYKHGYAIRIVNSIIANISRTYIQKFQGKLRGNQLEILKHEFVTILSDYVNGHKIEPSALRNIEIEMDTESKLHVILNIQIVGYIDTLLLEVSL